MKDVHEPLRTLFYSIITDKNLVCYEAGAVPDDAPNAYVIIADISIVENSNKTDFGQNVLIMLDLVTKYNKNKIVGSKEVDQMAGEILEVINSKIKFPIFNGLQIVTTKIVQDQKLNSKSDTHRIYRRLIRFQQLIMEV